MVCSIDDIVSRRPGKHTRFPILLSLFIYCIFFSLSSLNICASPDLCDFSFALLTLLFTIYGCRMRIGISRIQNSDSMLLRVIYEMYIDIRLCSNCFKQCI